MRIAMIQAFLPGSSNGGAGHAAHQLANRLTEMGNSVTMFSGDLAPASARYDLRRVTAGRSPAETAGAALGTRSTVPGVEALKSGVRLHLFAALVARERWDAFDVVHAHGDSHFLRSAVPVVRTFHGAALGEALHQPRLKHRLLHASLVPWELVASARASFRVAVSHATRKHVPWIDAVIPNGIDTRRFTPSERKSEAPTVLFVGHALHDRKRAWLVLKAFQEEVRPRLPHARLHMVMDQRLSSEGVVWHSNLATPELIRLYQEAWVFCLPSMYEGFGRPYAEAMACGTPVVATPNAGALEVLDHGRYGVLVREEQLGAALAGLLRDDARRTELSSRGLERAQEYSLERVADAYHRVYGSVPSGRARHGSGQRLA